jgi:hypothetical protein
MIITGECADVEKLFKTFNRQLFSGVNPDMTK